MTLEPAVVLRLMGIQIVEDDMDGRVRISAATISFMKSRNSTRRRRRLWAVMILPVVTSNAANNVEVPCRL